MFLVRLVRVARHPTVPVPGRREVRLASLLVRPVAAPLLVVVAVVPGVVVVPVRVPSAVRRHPVAGRERPEVPSRVACPTKRPRSPRWRTASGS